MKDRLFREEEDRRRKEQEAEERRCDEGTVARVEHILYHVDLHIQILC